MAAVLPEDGFLSCLCGSDPSDEHIPDPDGISKLPMRQ